MADKPIFRHSYPTEPERDRANLWGDRYYFSHADDKQVIYPWLKANLAAHPAQLSPEQITAKWTFAGRWDPQQQLQTLLQLNKE
jgi:pectinesterase